MKIKLERKKLELKIEKQETNLVQVSVKKRGRENVKRKSKPRKTTQMIK